MTDQLNKESNSFRAKALKFLVGLGLIALVAAAIWINYHILNYFW